MSALVGIIIGSALAASTIGPDSPVYFGSALLVFGGALTMLWRSQRQYAKVTDGTIARLEADLQREIARCNWLEHKLQEAGLLP